MAGMEYAADELEDILDEREGGDGQ